jgi:hypothetical protein
VTVPVSAPVFAVCAIKSGAANTSITDARAEMINMRIAFIDGSPLIGVLRGRR